MTSSLIRPGSPRRLVLIASAALCTGSVLQAQDKITYTDHIRPIFESSCLNCHNPDKKKGDLDLSTYAGTMAGGSGGKCVDDGLDPASSSLWKVVAHTAEPYMPPKSDKLSQDKIDLIGKWIQGGVLETSGSAARAKKKSNFAMAATGATGKPEGPPPMPEHVLLDPVVPGEKIVRPQGPAGIAHSPWGPLLAVAQPKQVVLFNTDTGDFAGVLPAQNGTFPECISFPNGNYIFSGGGVPGAKGCVSLWDVKTGDQRLFWEKETEEISETILAAGMSRDGSRIALGGPGKRLKIFDAASAQLLVSIKKHTGWITAVAFSPDGVLCASGDRDGNVFIWEAATGNEFYTCRAHDKAIKTLAWRPDSNLVVSGSEDGNYIAWEMQNGGQVKKVGTHGGVLCAAYAPDGRLLTGGRDGHLRIWDGNFNQTRDWVPSGGVPVVACVFNHDGTKAISAAQNGEMKIWDAAKDGEPLKVLAPAQPSLDKRLADIAAEEAAKLAELQKAQAAVAEVEKVMAETRAAAEKAKADMVAKLAESEAALKTMAQMQAEEEQIAAKKKAFTEAKTKTETEIAALTPKPAAARALPAGVPAETAARADEASASLDSLRKSVLENKLKVLTETLGRLDAEIAARAKQRADAAALAEAKKRESAELQAALPGYDTKIAEAQKAAEERKPAVAAADGSLNVVKRAKAYWLAAKENKTVIALSREAAALAEKLKDLQEGIPVIEGDVKALTDKKAAQPPPAPEELGKIDKEIAENQKRLEEAKKELTEVTPKAEELKKAVEEGRKKYLEMLPK